MPIARHVRQNDIAVPGAGGANVLFHSDWSTALGTDDNAVRDMGKAYPWDAYKGSTPRGATVVVTAASLGIASPGFANCMLIKSDNNSAEGVRLAGSLPNMQVGESRSYRAYQCVVQPDLPTFGDTAFHPFDLRNNPTQPTTYTASLMHVDVGVGTGSQAGKWWPGHRNGNSGGNDIVLGPSTGASQHPLGIRYGATSLFKNAWYGMEVNWTLVAIDTLRFNELWIYDVNGEILYDKSDYYQNVSGGPSVATSPVEWTIEQPPMFTWQQCGVNGFPAGYPICSVLAWGAVVIAEGADPIGPWNGAY